MDILYHSAAPTVNTGYGRATREIATRIHGEDHTIAIQTMDSVRNKPIWWHGEEFDEELHSPIKLLPGNSDLGLFDVNRHFEDIDADFYFTHFDTWMKGARDRIPEWEIPYASYVIVDHYPCPKAVVDQISNARKTITMSKFGKEALEERGVRPRYIPHGVHVEDFYPMDDPPSEIELSLLDGGVRRVNVNDTFIVGMVAANLGDRKHIPEQMQSFKMLLDNDDEDALLYIHTKPNAGKGFDLSEIKEELGIPDKNLATPTEELWSNMDDDMLNSWYNAFNVLLNCSRGESWGFTITEAQAAGTPCIVTNFSSMPEQLGLTPDMDGWHSWMSSDKRGSWIEAPHGIVVNPVIGQFREKVSAKQFLCHPEDIYGALRNYYYNEQLRKDHGKKAAEYVRNNYTWKDHVVPKFKQMFDEVENKL